MVLHTAKNTMKHLVPEALWKSLRRFYHRRLYSWAYFDPKFVQKRFQNKRRQRTILFYPDDPQPYHVIYKLCHLLGIKRILDMNKAYDAAFHWHDATFSVYDEGLDIMSRKTEVINSRCLDISKKRVDHIFEEVFGYRVSIDPLTFRGECLKKSNLNASDAEAIIQCPVKTAESGFIYQRLINNAIDKNIMQDIAIPVLKGRIPFAYLKYFSLGKRFDNCSSRIEIAELEKVVSKEEKEKILIFCEKIGLDYGELDMIRDRDDEKLYIIDVNTTPIDPVGYIVPRQRVAALKRIAKDFERFID